MKKIFILIILSLFTIGGITTLSTNHFLNFDRVKSQKQTLHKSKIPKKNEKKIVTNSKVDKKTPNEKDPSNNNVEENQKNISISSHETSNEKIQFQQNNENNYHEHDAKNNDKNIIHVEENINVSQQNKSPIDSENINSSQKTEIPVEQPIWEKMGMSEEDYNNKPMWSWGRLDFKIEEYGSLEETELACQISGKNSNKAFSCTRINSASGRYLGEMLKINE